MFVELHVEQGRALDLVDAPVAVASSIWPHGRWEFTFGGEANHAGSTRLVDRRDPMLAFASSVHSARAEAAARQAVATFGKVIVSPNGANAIPSQIRAWLDARAADEATLTALVDAITAEARRHAGTDSITLDVLTESLTPIVEFPEEPRARLTKALSHLGDIPVLPTAAGHDAGILSALVPTAMLFVRNPTGVSHSPRGARGNVRLQSGCGGTRGRHGRLGHRMTDWWCEHAWLGGDTVEAGVMISVDDGRITSIRSNAAAADTSNRLYGLVIPGMGNAHSHAFHRALRARTQRDRGSFWTWRDLMYRAADRLDPERYRPSRAACTPR